MRAGPELGRRPELTRCPFHHGRRETWRPHANFLRRADPIRWRDADRVLGTVPMILPPVSPQTTSATAICGTTIQAGGTHEQSSDLDSSARTRITDRACWSTCHKRSITGRDVTFAHQHEMKNMLVSLFGKLRRRKSHAFLHIPDKIPDVSCIKRGRRRVANCPEVFECPLMLQLLLADYA
jgi:hypothetical protein